MTLQIICRGIYPSNKLLDLRLSARRLMQHDLFLVCIFKTKGAFFIIILSIIIIIIFIIGHLIDDGPFNK